VVTIEISQPRAMSGLGDEINRSNIDFERIKEESIAAVVNDFELPEGDKLKIYRIRGMIFEQINYRLLEMATSPGYSLLSPDKTLSYMFNLQKEAGDPKKIVNIEGTKTLSRATVPDGLLMAQDGPSEICTVFEYTACNPKKMTEHIRRKKTAFSILKTKFPKYFAAAELKIVVPKSTYLNPEKFTTRDNVEVIFSPLDRDKVGILGAQASEKIWVKLKNGS